MGKFEKFLLQCTEEKINEVEKPFTPKIVNGVSLETMSNWSIKGSENISYGTKRIKGSYQITNEQLRRFCDRKNISAAAIC